LSIEPSSVVETPKAATPAAATHLPYRPDIDGLRAVAVLSVVLFHAFPPLLPGGFIGVDVFFVISGFLISGILLRELQQDRFSIAGFYVRRVKRIFPSLLAVMFACLAFGWYALFPDEYAQLGKHVGGGASFSANFFYWAQVGYFDTSADTKPLLHLWSLGIEEQFYIVWPAVLLLAWRRRANLVLVTAALALLSFVLNAAGVTHHGTATFYSPLSRAWELLAGALLACAAHRNTAAGTTDAKANGMALLGLALLAFGVALTKQEHFPGWRALVPVAAAVLLIAAGPRAWINRVVLGNRLAVGIGLVSYPFYLWHWPLLSFAQIVEGHLPAPRIRIAAVLAALVLAWLSYLLLERPLRGLSGRRARMPVSLLCALMAATGLAGAYVFTSEGLPKRAPIQDNLANQKALVIVEDKANAAACKRRYGFASMYEYCLLAWPDRDPTVALLGDSHAYHVVAGLTNYYKGRGENLMMMGTRVPYWNLAAGDDPYQKATQPMLELALKTPSIRTVIFATHLRLGFAPGSRPAIDAARETYRRFLAAGKRVIVIEDIPDLSFDPRTCIKRAGVASSATTSPCAIPRSEWDSQVEQHEQIRRETARMFPEVEWFRASDALCDERQCRAMIDGHLMYRDIGHLSYEGDLWVGSYFARWAEQQDRLPKAGKTP
jgi:peptidoglycan/LPS O-acetylase OafA/YrhL